MSHLLESLLIGLGIYGAIAAAMLALWGLAIGAIMAIAAIFSDDREVVDNIAGAR